MPAEERGETMEARYARNIGTITQAEHDSLASKRVCVVGCGGLGGGVIENLARMGVGHITAVDGDVFDETNLNRQVLSNSDNVGHSKAVEAKLQMKQINPEVEVFSIQAMLDGENARDIIRGHHVVVDALDNVPARLILEDACSDEGITLIHGAIEAWCGEVAVVMPGSGLLHEIYGGWEDDGVKPSNSSFTPAVASAIEAAETMKVLLGRECLAGKLMTFDLLNNDYEVIEF